MGRPLSGFVRRQVLPRLERYAAGPVGPPPRILFDLAHEARAATDLDALLRSLLARVAEALATPHVALFVREDAGGRFACRMTVDGGAAGGRPAVVAADSFVVTRLRALRMPLEVGPEDFDAWRRAFEDAPAAVRQAREREKEALEAVGARLVAPVRTREQIIGLLTVGARADETPFSHADRELVEWIAGQLGFVIENARLVERMVAEERLRRELALAADVQQRLFPAEAPVVAHLELVGYCQPARGVGGDYYDFLAYDHDDVGIAVADVAGKGISAALVMSNVQASLRSQAAARRRLPAAEGALADMVGDMNRLLCGITDGATYVTFFYARFDPKTRHLTYVNGGHNAPVVAGLHGGTRTLGATGLPLGIMPEARYEEATVSLRSGDLLLAYTDGVTESRDAEGEEFGEHRLHALVTALAGLSPDAVRQAVVEGVRGWSGGAPPHDDLTFVVGRVM